MMRDLIFADLMKLLGNIQVSRDFPQNIPKQLECQYPFSNFWHQELTEGYTYTPPSDLGPIIWRKIFRFRESLKSIDWASSPLSYAMAQYHLGTAYHALPAWDMLDNLRNAIDCYEKAIEYFPQKNSPMLGAASFNAGLAYYSLSEGSRIENISRAIKHYTNALNIFGATQFPQERAMTQFNLGLAYHSLKAGNREENLRRAIECYSKSMLFYSADAARVDHAKAQILRGLAHQQLKNLSRATKCYQTATAILTPEEPSLYVKAHLLLASVYRLHDWLDYSRKGHKTFGEHCRAILLIIRDKLKCLDQGDVERSLNKFIELYESETTQEHAVTSEKIAKENNPTERHISAWLGDHVSGSRNLVTLDNTYTLNFKVGSPVNGNLLLDEKKTIPQCEIPSEGLSTQWLVTSCDVELTELTEGTRVIRKDSENGVEWVAKFSLKIPAIRDSVVHQLEITPRSKGDAAIYVFIFANNQIYREFTLDLRVEVESEKKENSGDVELLKNDEAVYGLVPDFFLRPPLDWMCSPGMINILVRGAEVYVHGHYDTREVNYEDFSTFVSSDIDNFLEPLRASAFAFLSKYEDYLNDISPDDMLEKLKKWKPLANWTKNKRLLDYERSEIWKDVGSSKEFRDFATAGRMLFKQFFADNTELLNLINSLPLGCRINISWLKRGQTDWRPDLPWGLMYILPLPKRDKPIDPLGFMALRFRINYSPYVGKEGCEACIDELEDSYCANLLYWGDEDPYKTESLRYRKNIVTWRNQVLVPTSTSCSNPKDELMYFLSAPEPNPIHVLYLYCLSAPPEINDYILAFGSSARPEDTLSVYELWDSEPFKDRPLVFANACATLSYGVSGSSKIEQDFCERTKCRSYIGTEERVPAVFASRFATLFFYFFYRQFCKEPITAGEALTQSRLFLWENYGNIGGIFYSLKNLYEFYMATREEFVR